MRVGVIGEGILGGQITKWYRHLGCTVQVYDPPKSKQDTLEDCEAVFICVPTDSGPEGALDMHLIESSAALLGAIDTPICVILRSTLMPGTTKRLAEKYPRHTWVFLPEFLTERTAEKDFLSPELYIIGSDSYSMLEDVVLRSLPAPKNPDLHCSSTEAEVIKLASNAFYATKLSFMNQLYDLLPTASEKVFQGLASLWMVGRQHTNVHQDGYRGFGGKCLPKDSRALLRYAEHLGKDMSILRDAIEYNDRLRSSR